MKEFAKKEAMLCGQIASLQQQLVSSLKNGAISKERINEEIKRLEMKIRTKNNAEATAKVGFDQKLASMASNFAEKIEDAKKKIAMKEAAMCSQMAELQQQSKEEIKRLEMEIRTKDNAAALTKEEFDQKLASTTAILPRKEKK